jgi:hypothetical protein
LDYQAQFAIIKDGLRFFKLLWLKSQLLFFIKYFQFFFPPLPMHRKSEGEAQSFKTAKTGQLQDIRPKKTKSSSQLCYSIIKL